MSIVLRNEERQLEPKALVDYLNRYIIGQGDAKKAVAVALRNRWRRKRVVKELRDEILPKNILMMGPTGVGKTEIARRLSKLMGMPFVKVEASKYTEVGYVGRDVESMVRDLMDLAVSMVKKEQGAQVRAAARARAEEQLLDLLLPRPSFEEVGGGAQEGGRQRSRENLLTLLRAGSLDEREVTIEVNSQTPQLPMIEIFSNANMGDLGMQMKDMMANLMPGKNKARKMKVGRALEYLEEEEASKLVDMDKVVDEARERVEQSGIIFLDELDKVASAGGSGKAGPDVSREGVQRDLLPLVEGTTVNTRHGPIKTDHILFIAAGAFHVATPSDLIPELQGRFPIRVELEPLGETELRRILVEPENSLLKQYTALMATEGVELEFTEAAITAAAAFARKANSSMENIGARRLHTVMERLLEDISFSAPDLRGQKIVIDAPDVEKKLAPLLGDQDLARYIL